MNWSALKVILIAVYTLAWLTAFYQLFHRSPALRMLAWIPAAICAFAVPLIVSDIAAALHRDMINGFLILWSTVPLVAITVSVRRRQSVVKKPPTRGNAEQSGGGRR